MPIKSDLSIDVSKLKPEAVSESTTQFNDNLIKILESGPKWYEVIHTAFLKGEKEV